MRARLLRPVSALIRLDLPTLERPAKAISMPVSFGSVSSELAAQRNCQSLANNCRPALISADVKSAVMAPHPPSGRRRILLQAERTLEVVEQFDLGAVLLHDDRLLRAQIGRA